MKMPEPARIVQGFGMEAEYLYTQEQMREALAQQAEELKQLQEQNTELDAKLAQQDHNTAELEQEARLMRARMDRLQAERNGVVLAIVERIERACGATGMPPTLIRREFMQPEGIHIKFDSEFVK